MHRVIKLEEVHGEELDFIIDDESKLHLGDYTFRNGKRWIVTNIFNNVL